MPPKIIKNNKYLYLDYDKFSKNIGKEDIIFYLKYIKENPTWYLNDDVLYFISLFCKYLKMENNRKARKLNHPAFPQGRKLLSLKDKNCLEHIGTLMDKDILNDYGSVQQLVWCVIIGSTKYNTDINQLKNMANQRISEIDSHIFSKQSFRENENMISLMLKYKQRRRNYKKPFSDNVSLMLSCIYDLKHMKYYFDKGGIPHPPRLPYIASLYSYEYLIQILDPKVCMGYCGHFSPCHHYPQGIKSNTCLSCLRQFPYNLYINKYEDDKVATSLNVDMTDIKDISNIMNQLFHNVNLVTYRDKNITCYICYISCPKCRVYYIGNEMSIYCKLCTIDQLITQIQLQMGLSENKKDCFPILQKLFNLINNTLVSTTILTFICQNYDKSYIDSNSIFLIHDLFKKIKNNFIVRKCKNGHSFYWSFDITDKFVCCPICDKIQELISFIKEMYQGLTKCSLLELTLFKRNINAKIHAFPGKNDSVYDIIQTSLTTWYDNDDNTNTIDNVINDDVVNNIDPVWCKSNNLTVEKNK
nr:MAG: hypothetical protein [Metapenaeopsis lamellata majanivirus]